MKRLMSCTVWCAFMRATMRLPSYSLSWMEVVGLLSSTPSHSPAAAAALLLAAAWLLLAPAVLLPPRVLPDPPKATYLHTHGNKTGHGIDKPALRNLMSQSTWLQLFYALQHAVACCPASNSQPAGHHLTPTACTLTSMTSSSDLSYKHSKQLQNLLWCHVVLLCPQQVDCDWCAAVPRVQLTGALAFADTVDEVKVGRVVHVACWTIINCEDVVAVELHHMVALPTATSCCCGLRQGTASHSSQTVAVCMLHLEHNVIRACDMQLVILSFFDYLPAQPAPCVCSQAAAGGSLVRSCLPRSCPVQQMTLLLVGHQLCLAEHQ